METFLRVVMYHYVRDVSGTPFSGLRVMPPAGFARQLRALKERYEMATLESALAFLSRQYRPARSLCLLTFDDGLKEHFTECTPVLESHGVQGVFFLITGCLEERRVAAAHMNHFLTAKLGLAACRARFLERLRSFDEEAARELDLVDPAAAARRYRWDAPEEAAFKSFLHFHLDGALRDRVIGELFEEEFGGEAAFSRRLYLSWDDARRMREAGMVLGGHSHRHQALSGLPEEAMAEDLARCRQLLDGRLAQPLTPFSYPYGRRDSYTLRTQRLLTELSFACAFSTEGGDNRSGDPLFSLRRVDCKEALE